MSDVVAGDRVPVAVHHADALVAYGFSQAGRVHLQTVAIRQGEVTRCGDGFG